MSIHNAKALYTKLLADDLFRLKLEQASSEKQRYHILKEAGFSCTLQELKIAKNELLKSLSGVQELTVDEENMIQGGGSVEFLLDSFDRYLYF